MDEVAPPPSVGPLLAMYWYLSHQVGLCELLLWASPDPESKKRKARITIESNAMAKCCIVNLLPQNMRWHELLVRVHILIHLIKLFNSLKSAKESPTVGAE